MITRAEIYVSIPVWYATPEGKRKLYRVNSDPYCLKCNSHSGKCNCGAGLACDLTHFVAGEQNVTRKAKSKRTRNVVRRAPLEMLYEFPTREDIDKATAEIQANWTPVEERQRRNRARSLDAWHEDTAGEISTIVRMKHGRAKQVWTQGNT